MKDELFDDLIASTKEMVQIEKKSLTPDNNRVHTFVDIDVKVIRQATGLKQREFAHTIGVSYDLVKSWESKRRVPIGAARTLLLLIQRNPLIINQLKAA